MAYLIRAVQALTIGLIKLYQLVVSPYFGPRCRFYPTCSHYAISAVSYHGVLKGLWFTVTRLVRCNPWSKGGFDPVHPQSMSYIKNKEEKQNGY